MAKIQHPTHDDVSYDVPDADVKSWKDAGWRVTDAPAPKKDTKDS